MQSGVKMGITFKVAVSRFASGIPIIPIFEKEKTEGKKKNLPPPTGLL